MRGILNFLIFSLGIGVSEDDKGAVEIAEILSGSSNSKHVDVRYHVLRVGRYWRHICEVPSIRKQHTDILTKAIGENNFEKHRDLLLSKM